MVPTMAAVQVRGNGAGLQALYGLCASTSLLALSLPPDTPSSVHPGQIKHSLKPGWLTWDLVSCRTGPPLMERRRLRRQWARPAPLRLRREAATLSTDKKPNDLDGGPES